MKNIVYGFVASALLLTSVNAHDIWVEKNDKNQAQIFFGEFADNEKEGAKFLDRIKAETFYPQGIVKDVKRAENSIDLTLTKNSDLMLVEAGEPRVNKNTNEATRKISYAKSGREGTTALANFDLVPVEKNSNTFKLILDEKALAKTKITVISPTKWEKSFFTNEQGEVTITTPWKGTYLIEARSADLTKGEVAGKAYDKTINALTYSINVEQGIAWEDK